LADYSAPPTIASMSSTQSSATMATNNSQQNCLVDPLDSMLDFSEYETVQYQSPSLSPSGSKGSQFSTRSVSNTPPVLPAQQPTFNGPSHNYDMYRQTTGIPQGALANTLAVNSNNVHISQYGFADNNYLTSGVSPSEDFIDFGTAPMKYHPADMDAEFDSPNGDASFFFQESNDFIDPSSIASNNGLPATPTVVPTQTSNVGRLWPGMHQQQAALAKAQAQQKQQQLIIQQQRQNATGGQQKQTSQRSRASNGPADPIVEEKISQLLNSMRQGSATSDGDDSNNGNMSNVQRMRKDEEDMDEDERLLASEEGKKLSSKERRQLRNKVSARAFRSRRKGESLCYTVLQRLLTIIRIHWTTRRRDCPKSQRKYRPTYPEPCFDGGEHPSLRPHPHAPLIPIVLRFSRHSLPEPSCCPDCISTRANQATTAVPTTGS